MFKKILLAAVITVCGCGSAFADSSFSLTTSASTGASFQLLLNDGVTATLTWGNGETEEVTFNGEVYATKVKAPSLKVSSTVGITSIYAPSNQITALDVQGTYLTLETLVVSDNNLEAITFGTKTYGKLTTLVCDNNAISALSLTRMTKLTTLWCQSNVLKTLDLSKQKLLRKLDANDNQLTSLTLASSDISELEVGNNDLSGDLDLSSVNALYYLDVTNNDYNKLLLNTASSSKSAMEYFYAGGNSLFFNSFPSIYNKTGARYTLIAEVSPQRPYFHDMAYEVGKTYDVSDYFRRNGWAVAIAENLRFIDETTGEELVSGTDFTKSGYNYTFLTEHRWVYVVATSDYYPGVELRTKAFGIVKDLTGIDNAVVTDVQNGDARIYDLAGRRVSGNAAAAKTHGVYIINNKKVLK